MSAVFLSALYALAVFLRSSETGFLENEIVRLGALGTGFLLPHILGMFLWQSKPKVENLLITVVLLLLLADPQSSFFGMLILGLLTALIKTVVRVAHQPLFNPAAAGLLAASWVGVLTTWWGVSFSPRLPIFNISIAMLLTLPLGIYVIARYKKWPTLVSVPMSLLIVYFLQTGRLPLVTILEGTFAFFLLVMATEPRTTPVIDWQEWIFGVLLGVLLAVLFVHRVAGDPYLVALLIVNFFFGVFKFVQLKLALRGRV